MNVLTEHTRYLALTAALLCGLLIAPPLFAANLQQSQRSGSELEASFLYLLSNFSGPVPSQWARLGFDPQQQETYTLTKGLNEVRVFNPQGMEIFAFGGDGDIVSAVDIASGADGTIYVLSRDFANNGIQVLNYRGEVVTVLKITDLPQQFSGFNPDQIDYQGGHIYLLDSTALQVVITSSDGTFNRGYDLAAELNGIADERDTDNRKSLTAEISGFSIDGDGHIYFTTPTLFSAFRLNPDGSLDPFGTSGSGPGKFGVVSGIVADSQGNIYVADRLRSVVMIFDASFVFQGEFGYRGNRPQDMIVPDELVIDRATNRIFVSQAANKGVGVYQITLR